MRAALLVGWLLWTEMDSAGLFDAGRDAGRRGVHAPGTETDEIARDLRTRARLRGIPGLEARVEGDGRLTGSVMLHTAGVANRPLPGVKVEVLAYEAGSGIHESAQTDEDGRFTFPRLKASPSYTLVVRHAPYREVLLRGISVVRDRSTDVPPIVLGAPTVLAGRVVDSAGRPVSAAEVQVFTDRSRPFRRNLQEALRELQDLADPLNQVVARTDGRFLLRDLPPGRYLLRVSAPGYATSFRERVWVTPDERAPDLRVVLDPGAGCEGRVHDDGGRGISGARVIAVAIRGKNTRGLDRGETTTAPDGSYLLDSLIPGVQYFVEAWAEGYAPAGRLVQPEGSQVVDFELGRSGGIEGRILDAASGLPVPRARIMVLAGLINRLSPLTTLADAAGRYVFPAVSAGPVVVFAAEADGYPSVSFTFGGEARHAVGEGEVTIIDLELEAGVRVAGRIQDERGRPVAYATITFSDPQRRSEGERAAISATDGTYQVEGLRPGTSHDVRICAPGYAPLVGEDEARVVVTTGFMELDFTLEKGASLSGRVLDPEGAGVSGVRVSVEARRDRRMAERVQDLVAISGSTGAWEVQGAPPRVELIVRAQHDAWAPVESIPIHLRPGEERDVPLRLGHGARLEGRVVDRRGRPVEGARVRWGALREGDERLTRDAFRADQLLSPRVVRTGPDGTFVLDRLEVGGMVVKVEAEGHPDWYRRDLRVPAEGDPPALRVEMEDAYEITGRVLDLETRRAIPDVWIYARRADEELDDTSTEEPDTGRIRPLVSVQTDAQGRYVLPDVPAGRYEVVAWFGLGYQTAARNREAESTRREGIAAGAKDVDFFLSREP